MEVPYDLDSKAGAIIDDWSRVGTQDHGTSELSFKTPTDRYITPSERRVQRRASFISVGEFHGFQIEVARFNQSQRSDYYSCDTRDSARAIMYAQCSRGDASWNIGRKRNSARDRNCVLAGDDVGEDDAAVSIYRAIGEISVAFPRESSRGSSHDRRGSFFALLASNRRLRSYRSSAATRLSFFHLRRPSFTLLDVFIRLWLNKQCWERSAHRGPLIAAVLSIKWHLLV